MANRLSRLDAELVRRGLARSRDHAGELIAAGRVQVRGVLATKPATGVDGDASVRVLADDNDPGYVSRGGHKLAGALAQFSDISVAGKRCLDAGASTGGFTDVLLRAGAAEVVAVDVGYGQLAWSLRTDDRVTVVDRTNVRTLTPDAIGGPAQLTVADLSFISLPIVLAGPGRLHGRRRRSASDGQAPVRGRPRAARCRRRRARPRRTAPTRLSHVAAVAAELGWPARGVARSPLPGPSGNVEFFLWLRSGDDQPGMTEDEIRQIVTNEGSSA